MKFSSCVPAGSGGGVNAGSGTLNDRLESRLEATEALSDSLCFFCNDKRSSREFLRGSGSSSS